MSYSRGLSSSRTSHLDDDDCINPNTFPKITKVTSSRPISRSEAFDTLVKFLGNERNKDVSNSRRRRLDKLFLVGEGLASGAQKRAQIQRIYSSNPDSVEFGDSEPEQVKSEEEEPKTQLQNNTLDRTQQEKKEEKKRRKEEKAARKEAKKLARKAKKEAKKAKKGAKKAEKVGIKVKHEL